MASSIDLSAADFHKGQHTVPYQQNASRQGYRASRLAQLHLPFDLDNIFEDVPFACNDGKSARAPGAASSILTYHGVYSHRTFDSTVCASSMPMLVLS